MKAAALRAIAYFLLFVCGALRAENIQIDAAADRHAINPLIYGMNFASAAQLKDANCPLNRSGGNATSRYNWKLNATNHDFDYFFESIGDDPPDAAASTDAIVNACRSSGAEAMLTIPLIKYIATLGPGRQKLCSFSQAKYGLQTQSDQFFPDAGNGILKLSGRPIDFNDPLDAHIPNAPAFQSEFVLRNVAAFGAAAAGGVKYYMLDNEPTIWFQAHRDVEPAGLSADEMLTQRIIPYASAIRQADPSALICAPEEFGVPGYLYSGKDQQRYGQDQTRPDFGALGVFYIPYLLRKLREHETTTGERLLDVLTVHYYPQGSRALGVQEFSADVSPQTQLLRNRSTRSLWDPNYVDASYIQDSPLARVNLMTTLKQWVADNYPGLKIGITEYSWGADNHINGATAQADVLGILGREGADLAARWVAPPTDSPAYNAFKMYRNYDGNGSAFGETSVQASGGNADQLAVFAAQRTVDGSLTVMAIDKSLTDAIPVTFSLANFQASGAVHAFRLAADNTIAPLQGCTVVNQNLYCVLPQQSITLLVVDAGPPSVPAASDLTIAKMSITLNFTKTGADSVAIQGSVPATELGALDGLGLDLDVGGIARHFDLDAKGRAKSGSDTFMFSRAKNGLRPFSVKLAHGDFRAALRGQGLVDATVRKSAVAVLVSIRAGAKWWVRFEPQSYSARKGAYGRSR